MNNILVAVVIVVIDLLMAKMGEVYLGLDVNRFLLIMVLFSIAWHDLKGDKG